MTPTDPLAWLLPIVSDLNNIVEAIEDEGDRSLFGSTNDADRLKEIAQRLDDWRFEHTQSEPN
jgi:hypothetical protein